MNLWDSFPVWMILPAIFLGLLVLPYVVLYTSMLLWLLIGGIWNLLSAASQDALRNFDEWQIRREIGARVRSIPRPRGARFSQSRRSDSEIYGITQLLQDTMQTCCEVHHFAAKLTDAIEMDELREHGICGGYRSNTEDTLDVAVERLSRENVFRNPTFAK